MKDLEQRIKKYMSDYRYNHTLSVANECRKLARLFEIDGEKLIISAYLHDITKEMPIEEQHKLCEEFSCKLDMNAKYSLKTLHAFTAPLLIQKDFPEYSDEIILNTVRYHSTGRANMTLYEKLLYLADYIEPTRKFDDCKAVREFFYNNTYDINKRLDDAICFSFKLTISDLIENDEFIHTETINAYNFFRAGE